MVAADRTITAQGPTCHHQHQIDAPDWRARQQAAAELLNQGYGQPGTETGESGGELIVNRILVPPDGRELEGGEAGSGFSKASE